MLAFAVATADAVASAAAQTRSTGAYLPTAVEFKPRDAATIAGLDIVEADLRTTAPRRRPVTDLALRLHADGGAIDVALQSANETSGARPKPLLRAELYVVSGGRIEGPIQATCDRWRVDVSHCRIECDGGGFLLRRGGRQGLALVLGGTDIDGAALRAGFDACRTGAPDLHLVVGGSEDARVVPLDVR
jgi:hypothetical protein